MTKEISIYAFVLILFAIPALYAQSDFSSDMECEQSINFLRDNCFTCGDENSTARCKVEEFKYLGKADNKYYYSSIAVEYDSVCGMDADKGYNIRTVTIFEGKTKDRISPVYYNWGSLEVFEHVYTTLDSTENGIFIHIYIYDGNGGWDTGEYFVFRNGNWLKLKIPEIPESLISIIPKTYKFCRGGVINFNKMTYDLAVYKKYDGCCCPTGGTARAYLTLSEDNKIIITNIGYIPDLN